MAIHVWSVLCQKGLLDSYTNQVSIFDVIEDVAVSLRPAAIDVLKKKQQVSFPMSMQIVTLWSRSDRNVPETFEMRTVLTCPDGKSLPSKQTLTGNLMEHLRLRIFSRVEGFAYRGPGTYSFDVQVRSSADDPWKKVASLPLEVRETEIPAVPPKAQPVSTVTSQQRTRK